MLALDEVHLEDGHAATLVIVEEPAKGPGALPGQIAVPPDTERRPPVRPGYRYARSTGCPCGVVMGLGSRCPRLRTTLLYVGLFLGATACGGSVADADRPLPPPAAPPRSRRSAPPPSTTRTRCGR